MLCQSKNIAFTAEGNFRSVVNAFCVRFGGRVRECARQWKEHVMGETRHGINCPKNPHTREGYLHDIDDDAPYDIDGVKYCGRCHVAMPASQPSEPPLPYPNPPVCKLCNVAHLAFGIYDHAPVPTQADGAGLRERCAEFISGMFPDKLTHSGDVNAFVEFVRAELSPLRELVLNACIEEREKWASPVAREACNRIYAAIAAALDRMGK